MNVIKNKIFTDRVLDIIQETIEFVRSQIKERASLTSDGKFRTVPKYPEFAWKENIINAIAQICFKYNE